MIFKVRKYFNNLIKLILLRFLAISSLNWKGYKNADNPLASSNYSDGDTFIINKFNTEFIEKDFILISLTDIKNPFSARNTSSFQISLLNDKNQLIERQVDKLIYSVVPESLLDVSIDFDKRIDEVSEFKVSFRKNIKPTSIGIFFLFYLFI